MRLWTEEPAPHRGFIAQELSAEEDREPRGSWYSRHGNQPKSGPFYSQTKKPSSVNTVGKSELRLTRLSSGPKQSAGWDLALGKGLHCDKAKDLLSSLDLTGPI